MIETSASPLPTELRDSLARAIAQVNTVVLGKRREVRLAFVCLLAGGHLLIEDLPGVGKTTLAHALAATLGLNFQRVQFTSDLLPSDIIGVGIYEREAGRFKFHAGPLFTQLLLADEINRAMPKTQSALLEAMAEEQVTVDGITHRLAPPFFVVATQNPMDFAGTYPLPDSQLDRFMLRMSMGYPDREAERAMLGSVDRKSLLGTLTPCLVPEQIIELRHACTAVLASSGARRIRAGTARGEPPASGNPHRPLAARGSRAARGGARARAARRPPALRARGRAGRVPVRRRPSPDAGRERAARSRQARAAAARGDAGSLMPCPRRSPIFASARSPTRNAACRR